MLKQNRPEYHDPEKKTGRFRTKAEGKKQRSDKLVIDEKDLGQIEAMAGLGLNGTEIAHVLGMSRESLVRRQREDARVNDALHQGRAKAKFQVHKTAYQMATSGKCAPMTQFWLKARSGWMEKHAVSLTYLQEKYGVQDVNKLSDAQRIELAERCIAALRQDSKTEDDGDEPVEA